MLPSKNRLLLKNNNKKKLTQRIVSSHFTLLFNKREEKRLSAAIIVSKKVAPRAVDRNRIKRMVAESLKDKLETGAEMIIIVNQNTANFKSNEITEKINLLLSKIK
jgi:ribonuclease P protein component